MKILLAALLVVISLPPADAQTLKETSEQIEGLPLGMYGAFNDVLYTGTNECIYVTGKESIVGAFDAALVKVNSDLKVLWTTERTEGFLCAAKFANNIIVFSTEDWKKNTADFIKTIHAKLIDLQTGKTIREKDVYKVSDRLYVQPHLLTDSAANFQYLEIRYTKQDKFIYFSAAKREEALRGTTKIDLLSLTDNLDAKSVTLDISSLKTVTYDGSISDSKGDLFVVSHSMNSVMVEQYQNMQPAVVTGLKVKASFPEDAEVGGIISHGKKDDEIMVLLRTRGDVSSIATARFNFETKQVYSDVTAGKQLPLKQDPDLILVGFEYYKDKIIILSEKFGIRQALMTNNKTTVRYFCGDMHVSVCDSNFTLIKDIVVKKLAEFNIDVGLRSGYKISGDQLFVLSNTMPGALHIEIKYAVVDLNALTLHDGMIENTKAKGNGAIVGSETLWFNKTALTPLIIDRSITSTRKFDNILQKIEF